MLSKKTLLLKFAAAALMLALLGVASADEPVKEQAKVVEFFGSEESATLPAGTVDVTPPGVKLSALKTGFDRKWSSDTNEPSLVKAIMAEREKLSRGFAVERQTAFGGRSVIEELVPGLYVSSYQIGQDTRFAVLVPMPIGSVPVVGSSKFVLLQNPTGTFGFALQKNVADGNYGVCYYIGPETGHQWKRYDLMKYFSDYVP